MEQLNSLKQCTDDFPILHQTVNGKRLVYLDNSATSQKPRSVIDAIAQYYENDNANVHRGIHALSVRATVAYEDAHEVVADFIGAATDEVIFTRGTTESLNFVAQALGKNIVPGDEIVVSIMEHHSNFVPWLQIAKANGAVLKVIPLSNDFRFDLGLARERITPKTKVVAVAYVSNVLGTITLIKELAAMAHAVGALLVVDAAQAVPHFAVNVKDIDCDFLAFSGHKMFGPTGIGVLYGKRELLTTLDPFQYGGGMIKEVSLSGATWNDLPWKFEAGTPNIAGAVGLVAAIHYIHTIGIENIERHNQELTIYALQQLAQIPGVTIIGPRDGNDRGPVISFIVDGIHPHDLSEILNQEGVAVRGGHHCAMPLMTSLGIEGTTRASFQIYNTKEDVDALVHAIKKAQEVFA